MRRILVAFASTTLLAVASPAGAQYIPAPFGLWGYPGAVPTPYVDPGYRWRERRRPHSLRNEDQQREMIDTSRIGVTDPAKNYAAGECAVGSSKETCEAREQPDYAGHCAIGSSEETCRARGQKYNPPKN